MTSFICFHRGPFTEFERLSDDAHFCPSPSDRVRSTTIIPSQHLSGFRPRMDVKESKDTNIVTATFELPGLQPEDVTINFQQNCLTVSGESSTSDSRETDGRAVRERRRGKFSRTLQLPFGTKPEDVKAKLENGLLTVTFPRTTPEQEPQRITIQ